MMRKLFATGTALLLSLLVCQAAPKVCPVLSDSAEIALLTCSPGEAIYELFGHTAIRVSEPGEFDVVVNYGLFSFAQDHFIWRFVKGETDYSVGYSNARWFLSDYAFTQLE